MNRPHQQRFVQGPEHPCGYLDGRIARNLYFLPDDTTGAGTHASLSAEGFRRSGNLLYRPDCAGCNACTPTRIAVEAFRPNRSQRRVWKTNRDVTVLSMDAQFLPEHYRLYRQYIHARHPGGGMDQDDPEQYWSFIDSHWARTRLWEFRLPEQLLAVAVVDEMSDSLSAMYTFFDPACHHRSPGVLAILHQIEQARQRGLPWLYLGYWIRNHPKMSYKVDYRPAELRTSAGWETMDDKPQG